jgi:hypothetical protein
MVAGGEDDVFLGGFCHSWTRSWSPWPSYERMVCRVDLGISSLDLDLGHKTSGRVELDSMASFIHLE